MFNCIQLYTTALCKLIGYCFSDADVGFEMTSLVVYEDQLKINVCVIISRPNIDCPVAFPFDLNIIATDGTAGRPNTLIRYIGEYLAIVFQSLVLTIMHQRVCYGSQVVKCDVVWT